MGKKKRILRSPKFAHLRRMRKWQTLVEANSGTQPVIQQSLVKEEAVIEAPTLKLAEKELAPKVVEAREEKPLLKEEAPPLEAVKVTKKVTPHKTKVTAKKKTTTKARAKKTTSKK
tara:strand:- start:64 stop:411 length:348 start_codon:yes stop_codon:yes gene_type:complete